MCGRCILRLEPLQTNPSRPFTLAFSFPFAHFPISPQCDCLASCAQKPWGRWRGLCGGEESSVKAMYRKLACIQPQPRPAPPQPSG